MDYVLGLDVGIASVGWAVLNLDRQRIEDLGVRAFSEAEDPKTKAPLAEPRRLARGARRRLRRRAGRLERAKRLFVTNGLIHESAIESAFTTAPDKSSPWQLRSEGLERQLTGEELARALFHIIKRRGFKSNRKKEREGTDEETRAVLGGIEHNRQKLATGGYRTAGEMFWKDPEFAERKRNSLGQYGHSVDRGLLDEEIGVLLSAQREFGSAFVTDEMESDLMAIFRWQMPFAKGAQILNLVGACRFEPEEKRAPKHAPTTERFTLLGHINRLVITERGQERRLDAQQRALVEQYAYSLSKVTYKQLRAKLGLESSERFKGLTYSTRKRGQDVDEFDCEKAVFAQLSGYHAIQKAMEESGVWTHVKDDTDTQDHIAFALTFYKTDEDIQEYLTTAGVAPNVIAAAESIQSMAKAGGLSLKAMRRIIPYLEEGMLYSDACAAAGYQHSDSTSRGDQRKLPVLEPGEVRNPVVLRSLSQARKVINAVIDRYGPPGRVHIELAREVAKSPEERNKISKAIEDNRAAKEADRERFVEEFRRAPNDESELVKFRLYREQNGQCPYCGGRLDVERLFDPGYAEIDHILPYSRSFDDSLNNRVVVMSSCNQNKRNQTPHEWLGHDETRWAAFEGWTLANMRNFRKRQNLLAKDYARREGEWFQRNLTDTQYTARFLSTYIRQNLRLANRDHAGVMCLNGRVVAMARGLWGIAKIRSENDLHHAADAAVIAAMTPQMVKKITRYHQALENRWLRTEIDTDTGEITEFLRGRKFTFPAPWEEFRRELQARLSDDPQAAISALGLSSYMEAPPVLKPVIVSRAVRRKMTGAIHKETIRGIRYVDRRAFGVTRKALQDIKLADLDRLYGDDTLLRDALKAHLREHGEDAKKAFRDEFRKPERNGEPGPVVRSVRLLEPQPSGIKVRGGIADNGSMVRTDVFRKDGKYYLVPIYVSDVMAGVLPNRAIASGKPESEWPAMEDADFVFSLQPYDLIRVDRGETPAYGYYRSTDRATAALTLSEICKNDALIRSIGVKTARAIEKYQVSVLGDIQRVKHEKRRGLENRKRHKSIEASD